MAKGDFGFIAIHRKLKSHWVWSDATKLKWWLDILLSVNFADGKILIKGELIECKRGQSVKSLETWAKEWLTTKKTVRNFFILLQKDKMISVENIKVSTRITICNYDSYNTKGNGNDPAEETVTTPQGKLTLHPNNKGNNDNKEEKKKLNAEIAIEKTSIVMSDKCLGLWMNLCESEKWKKKSIHALELSLSKIIKYNDGFRIYLIESAIERNYLGLVFPNTDIEYNKWMNLNSSPITEVHQTKYVYDENDPKNKW